PGLMGKEHMVSFKRVGHTVQLLSLNLHARAPAGTPLARAVAESYSDSLLAAVPLAAAPHPDRKSLLVDATALLGGDIPGMLPFIETGYRLPFTQDRANSHIDRSRTDANGTYLTFRNHYAVPRLPAPPAMAPPSPVGLPSPSQVIPDARSFFINLAYTLAPLPAQPMRPRHADQRVGYFVDSYVDFGNDASDARRTHLITRWRLEKKDPAAPVSDPKEPRRVVMDRNIPPKWRDAVKAGIVEWNSAFERAGFRNALSVEQQADDADWTAFEGTRVLAVRWFAMEGPGATAVGPSATDPRTGEILRGAAIIPENWVRFFRGETLDTEPRLPSAASLPGEFAPRLMQCTHAQEALAEAQFAHELLSLRGSFDAGGPQAERFIADTLKDVTMHEVGHALGLRHNFKASTGITRAQLRDPAFTRSHGVSHSVMDYVALNIPLPGETVADYHQVTLGAYDHWAIEYGYREYPPQEEAAALAALAGRSATDTALAYGTDEDAFGVDPMINHRDIGDDPLDHARRRLAIARELWQRTAARTLDANDDLTVQRRNLQRGLGAFSAMVPLVAKHVGGVLTSRQLAGAGQPVVAPVPAARQREALDLLLTELFASASFRFDPTFLSRLGIDQHERTGFNRFITNPDFSLAGTVLGMQRNALDMLMSDGVAARLADAETKVADPARLLSFAEVQARLADAVWAELKAGREVDAMRRNLQREHLRRLASALLRPTSAAYADVRPVQRMTAERLEADLKRALAAHIARKGSATVQAHLAESVQSLGEALRAPLMKQGV
ncbi:MAG: zinc-dependent metalloprotease, partial [Aquabacterium sp.]